MHVADFNPRIREFLNWCVTVGSVLLCTLILLTRFPGMELLGVGPNWLLIWVVVCIPLVSFFIIPGYNYFITAAIVLFSLVTTIYNISRALQKGTCHYPLSFPFLKPKG